jgi:Holliday junction resolvase RusA-like endonuclease
VGEERQDGDPKPKWVFYQNPFYHFLFGFFGVEVPSKRTRLEIDREKGRAVFWQSESGQRFEALVRERLSPDAKWPLQGPVLLAIRMGLPSDSFYAKDIDNIAKSILDALKGLVFEDDRQVVSLYVAKHVTDKSSFFVGVRQLEAGEPTWHFPSLYSEEPYPGQVRR